MKFTRPHIEKIRRKLSLSKIYSLHGFIEVFFLCSLFMQCVLNSEDIPMQGSAILNSSHNPLTTLYGVPETNICGVNVLNGDYNYSSTDFDLPGSDPLVFERIYCSSHEGDKGLLNGWTHNFSSKVTTFLDGSTTHAIICGSFSGDLPFKTIKSSRLQLDRDVLKKGLTNCRGGVISGRTNIKNTKIEEGVFNYGVDNEQDNGFKFTSADGTEYWHRREIYRDAPEDYATGTITQSVKPNGMKTHYDLKNRHVLPSTNSYTTLTHDDRRSNRIKSHWPDFRENRMKHRRLIHHDFTVRNYSQDGKSVTYTFTGGSEKINDNPHKPYCEMIVLKAVDSNYLPSENYRYYEFKDKKAMMAERSGRYHKTVIEYYREGDEVELKNYPTEKVTPKHLALDRVKKIQVAVNGSQDLRTAYRFAYHENKSIKKGFTDVHDEYGTLTRFRYSTEDYRLNRISRYDLSGNVYRRDRLVYGAEKTPLEGDLLFKTIENPEGIVHYGENYKYDERGNVLTKKLHYRTFTRFKEDTISGENDPHSEGNKRLIGGEIKATRYTYNALNLTTSEDDGRVKTTYTYHVRNGKETSLPKSKLVRSGQKILKREFYDFDANAGCTLRIEDDGSGQSSRDLTGVRNRKIIRCINREGTFAGLPTEIDVLCSNGIEEERLFRTVLEYDKHGYVEKEKHYDANNRFAYAIVKLRDLAGNCICETDPLGQTINRKFSRYGTLSEEQGPSTTLVTKYSYDWLQHPTKVTRSYSDGVTLIDTTRFDIEGNLKKSVDSYGAVTKIAYNEQSLPVEIVHPPIRTESGWIKPVEKKEYNFLGHLISETDAKGAVTLYTPNDAGLPLKIVYPDGTSEEFFYSIYGEILEKTCRNGSKSLCSYDEFSRPLSEEIYDRDGTLLKKTAKKYRGSQLYSETDGEGVVTLYSYDYAGRVSKIQKASHLTRNFYDSLGRLSEERRYFGYGNNEYIATLFRYDLLNRVIKKKEIDGTGKIHSEVLTEYDCDSNITSVTTKTHAGIATTLNTYDPRGNLKSTTDPLGNTTYYNYRYDYYYEGRNLPCVEVIDPAGVKTTTVSDHHGSPIIVTVHSPFGKVLSETDMFYDLKGNLVKQVQYLDEGDVITLREYDSCSRLVRQVDGAGTAEQLVTTFVYNAFGELSETLYADGTSKHKTYDGIGRLSEEWSDDKSVHYRYTYNGQDLPKTALNCNTNCQTSRTYCPVGNLTEEIFENGLNIKYCYDKLNRRTACIYPDRSFVRQTYNPFYLETIERFVEDKIIYKAAFSGYNETGKASTLAFPGQSGTLALEYDLLNRPVSLTYPHYKETDIRYDERGLLLSKTVNDDKQAYTHDFLQQLSSEKTALYAHTYENDALHRQISVDGIPQTHNTVNQLTKGANDSYAYDAKGRRTNDSKTQYTYDRFDRLIAVEQGDSRWSYTYDAFNRKMSRTFEGKTTLYLYDEHEEIGSYNSEKECIDLKVLSAGQGSIPIAIELGKERYSPLISSQGHIVGLVEQEEGNLADLSLLTLFGKDLSEKPLSPWRFCGKRHEDKTLELIDFGYRFYHPETRQWLTRDPLGESDGPNLYAYVKNNPGCHVDRFGLFSFSGAWDCVKDACSRGWENTKDVCCRAWEYTKDTSSTAWEYAKDTYSTSRDDILSLGFDFTPFVGNIKSFGELIHGKDLITNEEVTRWHCALGMIPLGGNAIKGGLKTPVKYKKAYEKIQKAAKVKKGAKAQELLPFTKKNFRENLKRTTGQSPPKTTHAHHVFPKELAEQFRKKGIDVNDPKHGVWWESTTHWEAHGKFKYNQHWHDLLKEPLDKQDLYEHGRDIMEKFGKKVNF